MSGTELFWLKCKSCNRRGKYFANSSKVSYNQDFGLQLNWDIKCKFCNKPLKANNLADTSIKDIYIFLIAKNLDIEINQ